MTAFALPDQINGMTTVKSEDASEWHKLFAEAEKRIKEIEHADEGLDIPAINELRYAAFHLLEILTSSPAKQAAHAPKLTAHLQRAIYDASEALISLQLKELKTFQEDYRLIVVSDVVKNYQELMQQAEEASSLIKGNQRSREGRETYYSDALQHVDTLKKTNIILRAARDELNKKLTLHRRDSRRWLIGTVIAAVAATVGLAKLLGAF